MANTDDHDRLIDIKRRVTLASFELAAVRFAAKAGFHPDQPRVPAGDLDGGQWTDDGGGAPLSNAAERPPRAFRHSDGGRIVEDSNRANSDGTRSYSVRLPAGPTFKFATRSGVQTISDSRGRVVRQHDWLRPAPALLPQVPLTPEQEDSLFDAGRRLYDWFSRTIVDPFRSPTLAFTARHYKPNIAQPSLLSSEMLSRDEVRQICPRLDVVQALTDEATREAGSKNSYPSDAAYGTAVHVILKDRIDALGDPTSYAERSFTKQAEDMDPPRSTVRIDVIEDPGDDTICIYDIKTGRRGLSRRRSLALADHVLDVIAQGRMAIVTEVRPFE